MSDHQSHSRLPDAPRGPVLMSASNPTGWKLEELLPVLRAELEAKCARIASDTSKAASDVFANNRMIIDLLERAEILQRDTQSCLAAIGPDLGPSHKPRIGDGSSAPSSST